MRWLAVVLALAACGGDDGESLDALIADCREKPGHDLVQGRDGDAECREVGCDPCDGECESCFGVRSVEDPSRILGVCGTVPDEPAYRDFFPPSCFD